MSDDLVNRLRADELPGDRQRHIEARIELFSILNEAADRIEALEKALEKVAQHDLQAIALDALRPCERIALGEKKDD
jgi:hypothetical protein